MDTRNFGSNSRRSIGKLVGLFFLHNDLSGMVIYYATLLAVPLSTSGYKYWQVL